jgi:predicted nucleic acid-binding protein
MNAVDTNVLVYAFDADEPVKQAKAQQLLDWLVPRRGETELLWQVAGEFLSILRKWQAAGRMSAEDVEANFGDIIASFPLRIPVASLPRLRNRSASSGRSTSSAHRRPVPSPAR